MAAVGDTRDGQWPTGFVFRLWCPRRDFCLRSLLIFDRTAEPIHPLIPAINMRVV